MFKDIKVAIKERDKQRAIFVEFSSSVPERYTAEWERSVLAFEEDPTGDNPYEETIASTSNKPSSRCALSSNLSVTNSRDA